jgi:MFS superfamily sulfate permease-like transporter
MLPSAGSAQNIENARVVVALVAAGILIFWRYLLRIVLAIIAIAVGVGAVVLIQSAHH